MAQTVLVRTRPGSLRSGTGIALLSAATFGSSGPMARALLDIGWTPGAAVLVRLGGAAVVLLAAVLITRRGRPALSRASLKTVVVYGTVAMAGAQLSFFNAVRTLDVGVALLLEFLAPVMLLAWSALRTRTLPRGTTTVGAVLTIVGLAFVLELTTATTVDLVGVAWGLAAAVCLATFFVLSDRSDDASLSPLVMAAGGTAVGAVVIAVAGIAGLLPMAFTTGTTVLAGVSVSWLLPAAWLALVATSAAYLTGIAAIVRLGTRTASFVALTEVLFAVLLAWLLVAQRPGLSQLVGGACIIGGIIVIQRSERPQPPPAPAVEAVHPV